MSDKFTAIVVDDSNIIRMMMKRYLEGKAEIIAEGKDGREAVDLFKEKSDGGQKPDVILMDITMDNKDGIEAAREILEMDSGANIIMVSALNNPEQIKQCIEMGVSDYIVKPFTGDELIDAIQNTL